MGTGILYTFLMLFLVMVLPVFSASDARNDALGGMAVAEPGPAGAASLNPAALTGLRGLETSFSQVRFSANDLGFTVGAVLPVLGGEGGVGTGWEAIATRNQALTAPVLDSNGQAVVDPLTGMPMTQVLGFFTRSLNVFRVSGAYRVGPCSLGGTAKYYLSDFGSVRSRGFGFDIACLVQVVPGLQLGGGLFDLQGNKTDLEASSGQAYPFRWNAGLSWTWGGEEGFSLRVVPGLSQSEGGPLEWGGGLEAGWDKDVFLRAGLNQEILSAGAGLRARLGKVFQEVRVDYAYLASGGGNYPSRLTLSVLW